MAVGWNNLVGEMVNTPRGVQIRWTNGTAWSRWASSLPNLGGSWLIHGTSPCRISQDGFRLTFTNEGGHTVTGRFLDEDEVIAEGWGNLIGEIKLRGSEQVIEWRNQTAWTRWAGEVPNIGGTWYIYGDQGCTVRQDGSRLTFVNEHGHAAEGAYLGNNRVMALGWSNLGGTIESTPRGLRIRWDNQTVWNRWVTRLPSLGGRWLIHGSLPCSIEQRGRNLTFRNEGGHRVGGRFLDEDTVIAEGWGNLTGEFTEVGGMRYLSWANGTVWKQYVGPIRHLGGGWWFNGACHVYQSGTSLVFRNEHGDQVEGTFINDSTVVAFGWGNLVGDLDGEWRIRWRNQTTWAR